MAKICIICASVVNLSLDKLLELEKASAKRIDANVKCCKDLLLHGTKRQFYGPGNLHALPQGMKVFLNQLCLGDLLNMSEDDMEKPS